MSAFEAGPTPELPPVTAQTLGDFLRVLHIRPATASKMDLTLAEVRDHLQVVDLTAERAEAYAEVVDRCRKTPDLDVAQESWFAWQVALNRCEGHRIMTKAPQRYRGLVEPGDLA